jgi:DNA repair protein RecN (Recombination protein N)
VLTALRIKNFILMDELELSLEPGLNILTGETGAGKSIVIGALALVLGARASAEQVRPGADEAEIEALFDLSDTDPSRAVNVARLVAAGLLPSGELVIRRIVSASGRSRAYLNGRLCTTSELAALAHDLADVASQHESVALTDPSTHLGHLDRFAKLEQARSALAEEVAELEAILSTIEELGSRDRSRSEREAFVRFQIGQIAEIAPRPNEHAELSVERKRLRHHERLTSLVSRATERLESEDGLCDQLARVASDLRAAAELDESLEPLARTLDLCWAELREVAGRATRYRESQEHDEGRLAEVEERLYRIEGLLRQFGPTEADVANHQNRLERELADFEGAESRLAEERQNLETRLPAVEERAVRLSRERKRAADRLGDAISAELAELGMGGAKVEVEVEPLTARESAHALSVGGARLSRDGIDRVEFLIAPNKGIDPKPLRKIASGGELSRALLALKRVLAESGPAGLYVFDEVDTGVGGAVAERIGAAIADVARHHQVLCITHLAPIAMFAEAHFVVRKADAAGVTKSSVERVRGQDQVKEVARMLAGAKITPAAEQAAREMLDEARSLRALPATSPDAGKKLKKKRPQ